METSQDESTKQVVSTITSELKKTQNEFSVPFKIEDFCSELEMPVREQERYTSKDSIIVDNPPFDPNVDYDALLELIVFSLKNFCVTNWNRVKSKLVIFYLVARKKKV